MKFWFMEFKYFEQFSSNSSYFLSFLLSSINFSLFSIISSAKSCITRLCKSAKCFLVLGVSFNTISTILSSLVFVFSVLTFFDPIRVKNRARSSLSLSSPPSAFISYILKANARAGFLSFFYSIFAISSASIQESERLNYLKLTLNPTLFG